MAYRGSWEQVTDGSSSAQYRRGKRAMKNKKVKQVRAGNRTQKREYRRLSSY